MTAPLTSADHPLRIDAVALPGKTGLIGMTLCPGRKDPYASFGNWHRDLRSDLQAIRDWGASTVVTLVEEFEFGLLRVPDLGEQLSSAFHWLWLPIQDGNVPGSEFEARWDSAGPELRSRLAAGARVLVHCRAGLGRTGLVVARLLVEGGMAPALRAVRAARPGAVETRAQEQYVLGLQQK